MVSYSRDGCGITCFTMLGRIQMLAHLGRQPGEATVLPHGPYHLQHLLPFLLPTESFSVEWERGMGSPGEQRAGGVLCLLSAAEWSVQNCWHHWLPPPPLHLCCQRVRKAGTPLWSSCLGSSFICHSKDIRNKPRGMLSLLPRTTTPNYVGLWHAASPAVEPWSHPSIPRYFSGDAVASCLHCPSQACYLPANSVSFVKMKYLGHSHRVKLEL